MWLEKQERYKRDNKVADIGETEELEIVEQ